MTDFPDLKLKALVSFPAAVLDGAGIDVVKANGTFTFNLAFDDFAPPVAGISDPTHQNALLWNNLTNQYVLAPVSVLSGGGAVTEAPNDGTQYGRQSLSWTPIVTSTTTPSNTSPAMNGTAAPGVATAYSRGDHVHPTDTSRAPLASPVFTGNPTAPTPSPGDNDTSLATTAFVTAAISGSGGVVPSALTKTDDTNVTLTLGGTPATALLQATSITVGWAGTLGVARGGTNIAAYAVGDLLYASGATTLAKLADIATGNALLSGGVTTAPAWGKVGLVTHVTGILPVANGGLGVDNTATNGVPVFIAGNVSMSTAFVRTVKTQVFTASGTYTPNTGMLYAVIECVGGGGGGGGVAGGSSTNCVVAGGGGGGGYSRKLVTAADIGASKAVTIGAAGAAGTAATAPTGNGGNGGDTSVGVLCIAKGATGGGAGNLSTFGASGGVAGTGDVTARGANAATATGFVSIGTADPIALGGSGANSAYGGGGAGGNGYNGATAGAAATGYGSGGGGASSNKTTSTAVGGAGTPGLVMITEYCSQ